MAPGAVVTSAAVLLALAAGISRAHLEFVARIPNGNNVAGAHALGHIAWDGGGPLNPFGRAFAAGGLKWTKSLCHGDADGDGQTNGEELGDPCCVWVAGSGELPLVTDKLSHPGDFGWKLNETDLRDRLRDCAALLAAGSPSHRPTNWSDTRFNGSGSSSRSPDDSDLNASRVPGPAASDPASSALTTRATLRVAGVVLVVGCLMLA